METQRENIRQRVKGTCGAKRTAEGEKEWAVLDGNKKKSYLDIYIYRSQKERAGKCK